MKQASILFFLVLLISFFISLFFAGCSVEKGNEHPADKPEEQACTEVVDTPASAFEVVMEFCELISLMGKQHNQTAYATDAFALLSQEAQRLFEPYTGSKSEKLMRFAHVGSFPDQGFHVMGVIDITDEQAWVETRWNYSEDHEKGVATVKTFQLVKENKHWKIEKIY